MSGGPPLVSAILPTFNRPACVKDAVESVLAQTMGDWELVVADDGSGEDTRAYLRGLTGPRQRILWLPHTGNPSHARNAAIRAARGRYLAFLDSDDRWAPRKLEVQVRALLAAGAGRGWSFTDVHRIDAEGKEITNERIAPWSPSESDMVERLLTIEALVATPTVIAEKALVEAAGAFDEAQRFGEDYDLWIRLALRSGVVVVDEKLADVRVHGDNYSRDRVGAYEGWVTLYRRLSRTLPEARQRALARRREGESTLVLAGLHVAAARQREALGVLASGLVRQWSTPRWCAPAARMVGKIAVMWGLERVRARTFS